MIRRIGEPAAIVAGLALLGLGLLGVAGSAAIWQLLVSTVVLGAGLPLLIVAYNTLLQKQTPGQLMGRVSTTTEVLIKTPQAVSIATGALLVTVLGYRVIFLPMAGGVSVAAAYLATMLRGRLGPVQSAMPPVPELSHVHMGKLPSHDT